MSRPTPEREAEIRAEVALRIAAQPNERPNEEYLLAEIDALRGELKSAHAILLDSGDNAQALAARVRELERTLGKIADVMRRRELDDFLLSEIQDHLTMAGYDVPLRSYRDAALGPTRRDAP